MADTLSKATRLSSMVDTTKVPLYVILGVHLEGAVPKAYDRR